MAPQARRRLDAGLPGLQSKNDAPRSAIVSTDDAIILPAVNVRIVRCTSTQGCHDMSEQAIPRVMLGRGGRAATRSRGYGI